MQMKVRIKMRKYDFFEYLLVIAVILNLRSMWQYMPPYGAYFEIFYNVLLIVSCLFCIMLKNVSFSRKSNAGFLALMLFLYLMFYIYFNSYKRLSFLMFAIAVSIFSWYALVIFKGDKYPSFFRKYVDIMYFIAIVSLFIWLFGSVLGVIHPTGIITTSWTGSTQTISVPTYFGIQFEPQSLSFGWIKLARNSACFTEGPIAAFAFGVALLLEIFLKEQKSNLRTLVLILTTLSTLTVTGYLIVIVVLITQYISVRPKMSFLQAIKIIMIPVLFTLTALVVYNLFIDKLDTTSGSIRIDDFRAGYFVWRSNLLFGAGYLNEASIRSNMALWRSYNMGYSNSLMCILAQGGLYLSWLYLVPFIVCLYNFFVKRYIKELVFVGIIFVMFTITTVCYQYLMIALIIYFSTHGKCRYTQ